MRLIVEAGNKPGQMLIEYIEYIERETQCFREQYLNQLHWGILGAIREYTLRIMQKFIAENLSNYMAQNALQIPDIGIEAAANLLAYGIGGSILYQNRAHCETHKEAMCEIIFLLLRVISPSQ